MLFTHNPCEDPYLPYNRQVKDTLIDMYRKNKCRIKTHGDVSPFIEYNCGVNQGGNLSPLLFIKYLSDMSDILCLHHGVVINDSKLNAHLLWADDLVLVSDTPYGL
jgi:hypothetical protein